MQEYSFVIDIKGNKLDMTKAEKAWYKVRKGKARLLNCNPLTIQLLYEIKTPINDDKIKVGVDIGLTTGIAIVQECKTKNKVLFKAELHHRRDVKVLMTLRREYRRSRKHYTTRYRKARFLNRGNSKRKGRIPPSVKTHKDEILRLLKSLNRNIRIDEIHHEDTAFDIRAITDGYKPYKWEYQVSNRLDENIRKAVILRDNRKCVLCGKVNCMLEVHHIIPRRMNGGNTLSNLITLCTNCHDKVTGDELSYTTQLQGKIKGFNNKVLQTDSIIQIGKNYLYYGYLEIADLCKTNGGDTANKRIDWNIEKTHSNDAVVITDLNVKESNLDVLEYIIKPIRSKRQYNKENKGSKFKHGDIVSYTNKKGEKGIYKIQAILIAGTQKGKYKLQEIKTKKKGRTRNG